MADDSPDQRVLEISLQAQAKEQSGVGLVRSRLDDLEVRCDAKVRRDGIVVVDFYARRGVFEAKQPGRDGPKIARKVIVEPSDAELVVFSSSERTLPTNPNVCEVLNRTGLRVGNTKPAE